MERKLSKIYTSYAILFFALIISSFPVYSQDVTSISSPSDQIKVVDGDSLEIKNQRIRLIGIDAPEYLQTCKNSENKKYNCGRLSTNFLKKLIENKTVTCHPHSKDKYDRFLSTCYIDSTDINKEIVKNGHAILYLEDKYLQDQQHAKKHKLGIWNGDFIHPRLFRKLQELKKH
jgi:endonuclease YncB( thermonuclease family)